MITDNFSDFFTPSDLISFNSIYIIVCALDELNNCINIYDAFIYVAATVLCLLPSSILASIASYESTGYFVNPSTYTPYTLCSLTFKPPYGLLGTGTNKSYTFSL